MPRTMKLSQSPKTEALSQLKKVDELVCGCSEKQIEKACIISITAVRRKDCRRITGCSWMAKAEHPDKNPVSSAQHYTQSLAQDTEECVSKGVMRLRCSWIQKRETHCNADKDLVVPRAITLQFENCVRNKKDLAFFSHALQIWKVPKGKYVKHRSKTFLFNFYFYLFFWGSAWRNNNNNNY